MRKYVSCMLAILISTLLYVIGTLYADPNSRSHAKRILKRVDMRLVWTKKTMWFREPAPSTVATVSELANKSDDPYSMLVCVVSSNHERTERLVKVLNSALVPPNVSVRLVVAGDDTMVHYWQHGVSMVTRNVSSAWIGNRSMCFVIVDDTIDPGPFFIFWFLQMCATRRVDLISGDAVGSGLAPVYSLWKRFLRNDKRHGNLTARLLAFHNDTTCQPPSVEDNVIVRAEYQPMAERERPPRLARVWSEVFVEEAVDC